MVHKYITSTNTMFGNRSEAVIVSSDQNDEVTLTGAPAKKTKLLSSYSTTVISQLPGNSIHQLNKYLDTTEILNDDSMIFWHHNRRTFDKLYLPALRALSVPASSSAVERVFSQGGLILRPHRFRLNDRMFSDLIFLKCNKGKF